MRSREGVSHDTLRQHARVVVVSTHDVSLRYVFDGLTAAGGRDNRPGREALIHDQGVPPLPAEAVQHQAVRQDIVVEDDRQRLAWVAGGEGDLRDPSLHRALVQDDHSPRLAAPLLELPRPHRRHAERAKDKSELGLPVFQQGYRGRRFPRPHLHKQGSGPLLAEQVEGVALVLPQVRGCSRVSEGEGGDCHYASTPMLARSSCSCARS